MSDKKDAGPTLLREGMIIGDKSAKSDRAIDYIIRKLDAVVPRDGQFPRGVKKASDRFLILESGTGSGKSTTLPPEIFLKFEEHLRGRIAVTQPRIINTIQIAESIPRFYPTIKFGDKIGYSTGFIKRRPKHRTSIIYMTLPTVYNQMINMTEDKFLDKYSFIIIDEVHERSMETDLTFKLLKQFVGRHWKKVNCPNVILMSATFDTEKFSKYFGGCSIIRVRGEDGFAIKEVWPKIDPADFAGYMFNTAIELHEKDRSPSWRDNILMFLHKTRDILAMVKRFDEYNKQQNSSYIAAIPLTSATFKESTKTLDRKPNDIEFDVEGKKVRASRKVIVSSNLAETGVTFDDIRYVIDSGYYNSVDFSPATGATQVITAPVTQGMSRQRRGRVGRVAPGEFWPSYTRASFEAMLIDQYSDLIRTDITSGVLSVITQDIHRNDENKWEGDPRDPFVEFKGLMEVPSSTSLYYSLEKLLVLGLIDPKLKPTRLGIHARNFGKTNIEFVRAILASYWTGATPMCLINIAAVFSQAPIATRKAKPPSIYCDTNKDSCLINRDVIKCDMIEALLYFESFLLEIERVKKISYEHLQKWCNDRGLIFFKLIEAMLIRDEIIDKLIDLDFDPFTSTFGRSPKGRAIMLTELANKDTIFIGEVRRIKKALFEGFKLNVFYKMPDGTKHSNMFRPIELSTNVDCAYFMTESLSFRGGKFEPGAISVLDGFVDVDDDMFNL